MKHILIVEDDSAILEIYKMILEKSQFEVQAVSSGKEVLKVIKDVQEGNGEKPDVVLLDLILPDMDGSEVLKEIKQNDATKDIKVFIMTNKENMGEGDLGGVKPDEFLVKANVTPTEIIELIQKHLGS